MTVNTNVGPQYQLSFAYDAKGRRIQKLVATNGVALSTNKFLYDGWNLIAETRPDNSLIRSYVWGTDLSGTSQGAGGVGGLLEISYYGSSTTNCFPAYDGNGNIMALVNAADGTVAANYDYAAFGEPIRITGVMARNNPFRFSTKYADDESDQLYYGYRYYKPATETWENRDPIQEQGGMNLYCYLGNDAVDNSDYLGQWNSNVHLFKTIEWAVNVGFGRGYPAMIGSADNDTDSGTTSWWPVCGQEDRHMNFPSHHGKDIAETGGMIRNTPRQLNICKMQIKNMINHFAPKLQNSLDKGYIADKIGRHIETGLLEGIGHHGLPIPAGGMPMNMENLMIKAALQKFFRGIGIKLMVMLHMILLKAIFPIMECCKWRYKGGSKSTSKTIATKP